MNIATVLTASRLIFGPLYAFAFISGFHRPDSPLWLWAAVVFLTLNELSDAFDGFFARRRNEVTDFGKVFDPVCDSLSRLTAFISFMVCGIIPLWMFLVLMYRDSLMSLLRIICATNGLVLAARKSGKLKAIFQAIAIYSVTFIALVHAYKATFIPQTLWGQHPGFWLVLGVVIYTALSMVDYIIPNWKKIRAMMRSSS